MIAINVASCESKQDAVEKNANISNSEVSCVSLETNDSCETIRGTIFVDSKQNIIFDYDSSEWKQKVLLLPCGDKLKNSVLKNYDGFLNARSKGQFQYFSATGIFLVKHPFGVPRDTFLFYSGAMLDSL